jgi:hypothetical protein
VGVVCPLEQHLPGVAGESGTAIARKYIVDPFGILDITGALPVILMEIEPASGNIMKTYIYGNSEVLAQHDGDTSDDRYFYLHDRLGSVRLVIDEAGGVQNYYTYEPFGVIHGSGAKQVNRGE